MAGKVLSFFAVLAVCSGAVEARAQGAVPSCTMDSTTGTVTCLLPANSWWVDLRDVVSAAQKLNKYIEGRSAMTITAFGGAGAKGKGVGISAGGERGAGGSARLVTTLEDYERVLGQTTAFYYLGREGEDNHSGGKGGSSTIFARNDVAVVPATTTNVLLLAGGGGGGGGAAALYAGHKGGDGGKVSSDPGTANTAAGGDGHDGNGSGGGGKGGAFGSGGEGGSKGSGTDGKSGGPGKNGVGGQGGPVHISNGPSTATGWLNSGEVPKGIGTAGMGGEGQVRCDGCGEGGGGGGGYGGGGGGGGGGINIQAPWSAVTAGGGGGGGASYAVASTTSASTTATNPGHNGSVVFMLEEVCAGSESRGEAVAQKLLDDFIPLFNQTWPAIAVAENLDPYKNVYDGPVNIGCGSSGIGNGACETLTLGTFPICKNFYADVDLSEIDGLSHLAITSLKLTSTNQRIGTTCPYDTDAVKDTSFRCSLYGGSNADVKLTAPATATVSSIHLKIDCAATDEGGGPETMPLWSGNATCKSSSGTASGKVAYCAGFCSREAGVASLVALQASDLDMKLKPKCDVHTTSVDYEPITDVLDEVLDAVVNGMSDKIIKAATPAVTSALNDVVKDVLPLPATCSAEGARRSTGTCQQPPGSHRRSNPPSVR